MKKLHYAVFPSEEETIKVNDQLDPEYMGAHSYEVQNSLGAQDGKPVYHDSFQTINFVMKLDDGTMVPGVQSEQLAYILKDRVLKLATKYPHAQVIKMLIGLDTFLEACKERIEER